MGQYRARDLLLAPNLVSLTRLPLAVVFLTTLEQPTLALAILALAGLTDVIDGHLARRLGQATPTGAVLDGVLDKLFAALVIGGLVVSDRLSLLQACLLGAREIGELPLVLWWGVQRSRRRARASAPRANWLGKLATTVQFAAIAVVLYGRGPETLLLLATALCGTISAAVYWQRELAARA